MRSLFAAACLINVIHANHVIRDDSDVPEATLATLLLAITPSMPNMRHGIVSRTMQDVSMKALTKPERVNLRNRQYNKKYKSEMKTRIKNVVKAVEEGDLTKSNEMLRRAFSIIDKNVKRNIVHRNFAARKKSQLNHKVKVLEGDDIYMNRLAEEKAEKERLRQEIKSYADAIAAR